MSTQRDLVSYGWLCRLICVLVLSIGNTSLLYGERASPWQAIPCRAEPENFAIAFFEFVESTRGFDQLKAQARDVFSRTFMSRYQFSDVVELLNSARNTYGIDERERPLSARLAARPIVTPEKGKEKIVHVQILALSERGQVEQRVSLLCEDAFWKVMSFSYGPPDVKK